MIANDKQTSDALYSKYLTVSQIERQPLLQSIAESAVLESFPGALLPSDVDCHIVYAVAPSSLMWQRLAPLLEARIGHTLSDFSGIPSPVTIQNNVSDFVRTCDFTTVCQIRLHSSETFAKAALQGLCRLVENVRQYAYMLDLPDSPKPISVLLANLERAFEMCNLDQVHMCIEQLENGLLLDALNLNYLRLRYLVLAEDWEEIVGSGLYESFRHLSVPHLVSEALTKVGRHVLAK